jgi:hypothetical protein
MSTTRSWPERFKVMIRTRAGGEVRYNVVTWLGEHKAVAMAVTAHLDRHGNTQTSGIVDVTVTDMGPAARSPDGTVDIQPNELSDRTEF